MNYDKARQRVSDQTDVGGPWDWTTVNDGRIRPTGYCAGWPGNWPSGVPRVPGWDAWLANEEPLREKYHDNGHPTEEDAERLVIEHNMRRAGLSVQKWRCHMSMCMATNPEMVHHHSSNGPAGEVITYQ